MTITHIVHTFVLTSLGCMLEDSTKALARVYLSVFKLDNSSANVSKTSEATTELYDFFSVYSKRIKRASLSLALSTYRSNLETNDNALTTLVSMSSSIRQLL